MSEEFSNRKNKRVTAFLIATAVLIGTIAGLGLLTFGYAKGFSYMSNDPAACANCHIMNQQYESWMKSGHQHVAVCNDCHVPHNFFGKWYTKAENGFHHSWAFTFNEISPNIKARKVSGEIVQKNCVRCHETVAQNAIGAHNPKGEELHCISCHRSVGHGG